MPGVRTGASQQPIQRGRRLQGCTAGSAGPPSQRAPQAAQHAPRLYQKPRPGWAVNPGTCGAACRSGAPPVSAGARTSSSARPVPGCVGSWCTSWQPRCGALRLWAGSAQPPCGARRAWAHSAVGRQAAAVGGLGMRQRQPQAALAVLASARRADPHAATHLLLAVPHCRAALHGAACLQARGPRRLRVVAGRAQHRAGGCQARQQHAAAAVLRAGRRQQACLGIRGYRRLGGRALQQRGRRRERRR